MTNYTVKYTDSQNGSITVPEGGLNNTFDVAFPGRVRLEWGEEINEAFLNLLENFACPADPSNDNTPDLTKSTNDKLLNPVKGQLWYNKTNNHLYHFNGDIWEPYTLSSQDYAANWGQVNDGEILPRPVSSDGYVFPYEECIWSVSPFQYLQRFKGMTCRTDLQTSEVTMKYNYLNDTEVSGIANYLIVGIRGNVNNGIDDFSSV